ncbi:hypothetical protein QH494_15625 [Sphingomonas sp. AR_OL41]|uniref:hypothetical protein n=1 Tax=Sphingomonas sp. AR_OL41 TaxID=3042729 RepID=UPI0024816052|nr:hypothetical protein [Sphingomonas sp. AR_OL41]MDH7973621.1 hypothetical protein [Sphingomonas sp. AR_OL41]
MHSATIATATTGLLTRQCYRISISSMLPTSILPSELLAMLRRVGEKLADQQSIEDDYQGVVEGLCAISPTLLARAEAEIVDAAQLYRWRRATPIHARLFRPVITDREQLADIAGLQFLFLFHRDGHIREAALRKVAEPVPAAFLFVALAWRLNDWVAEVRAAAADCATRVFPITAPDVIAEAAMVLLGRGGTWGRWASERHILEQTLERVDVAENLADIFATRTTGPAATALRHSLRSATMDRHLARLARTAIQPAVRALATQVLIEGVARWPNGWRWRWIDKSMGIRQAETAFESRSLTVPSDRLAEIMAGLNDRSAAVRNTAIVGLMRHREMIPNVRDLAAPLLKDRSRRVRERAEFLLK